MAALAERADLGDKSLIYSVSRWGSDAASRARFRRLQHLCTRSGHDPWVVGPSRRNLRPLAMVPRPLFAFREEISPLPAAARRSQRLPRVHRSAGGVGAVRCAAADP